MFDPHRFFAECEAAAASGGQPAIRDLMAAAVAEPASITAALGEPKRAGIEVLHRSKTLTILNLVWGPHMTVMPHNHHMWAVIGIYGGREDNIFWRTLPPDARWPLEAAGASSLMPMTACSLGKDIIHSVTNPLGKLTGALHVYGGDFLKQEREEWDDETLRQGPYDVAKARRLFEDSNRALDAG
jgi:predicted metal-dependent enzyme (double-stranded beta helix superfamily)